MKDERRPALSTMWMQLRHETLGAFVTEARQIGFNWVELSHVVTVEQIAVLPEALYGAVRVLHHPCPNPGGVPELSELDQWARVRAVEAAKTTIEWAGRLGAEAVVLHLGLVGLDRRWENALRARWLQGQRPDEPEMGVLLEQVRALRAGRAQHHLDAARRSLAALLPVAEAHGVRLGLENGEWVASIPNMEEASQLLDDFGSPVVGLWLDTGHATIQERLGFGSLLAWAQLVPERLLGLHYHDVRGLRDHLIPGNGTIAWEALAPHIPAHALPTCEFDWYYTAAELQRGAEVLAGHGLVAWQQKSPPLQAG